MATMRRAAARPEGIHDHGFFPTPNTSMPTAKNGSSARPGVGSTSPVHTRHVASARSVASRITSPMFPKRRNRKNPRMNKGMASISTRNVHITPTISVSSSKAFRKSLTGSYAAGEQMEAPVA
jgi:hypothetical protein